MSTMFSSSSTFCCTWCSLRWSTLGKELFFADVEHEWTHVCRGLIIEDIVADILQQQQWRYHCKPCTQNAYQRILHRKITYLHLLLTAQLSQHEMTALFDIRSTTGLVTWVCPPSSHLLHFKCSKFSNHCKSDPCVQIQYDISESELVLELSPQVLTSTLRVWQTLHTEGMDPYHIQRNHHLKPADICSCLELCRWINSNPYMIRNILFTNKAPLTCDGVSNIRNSILWDRHNPHGTVESNYQHRFSINVWCGIIGDQLTGLFILPQHLTGDIYPNFLQDELPALFKNVALQTRWQMYYQHDRAPTHFSQFVGQCPNHKFPNQWTGRGGAQNWPPWSPDLNALDYHLWGYMKAMVYVHKVITREELLQRILSAARSINNAAVLHEVTSSLVTPVRKCIQADGRHFKQLAWVFISESITVHLTTYPNKCTVLLFPV